MVVPFLPRQHVARAALAYARRGKLPTAPLERTLATHRRAVREHLGRVDALRSELEAEGMATELLDGEQVVHLLWSCFNPTKADRGRRPAGAGELLGELDAPVEREAAIQAGMRLREAIAVIEPRLRPRLASRPRRSRRGADDRGRDDRGADEHGVAARGDADPPAVHAVRVRARARAPPRAPAAQARLPPVVHDQPRRGVPRPGAGLRPLRAGARVRGAARPARLGPADGAVSRLDLRAAPRPRARPRPGRAV